MSIICPRWYALWSAESNASRREFVRRRAGSLQTVVFSSATRSRIACRFAKPDRPKPAFNRGRDGSVSNTFRKVRRTCELSRLNRGCPTGQFAYAQALPMLCAASLRPLVDLVHRESAIAAVTAIWAELPSSISSSVVSARFGFPYILKKRQILCCVSSSLSKIPHGRSLSHPELQGAASSLARPATRHHGRSCVRSKTQRNFDAFEAR